MPGAKVVLINPATTLRLEKLTNASGAYNFPDLPIGNYTLNVSFTGFQTYEQSNIILISGQTVTIDVKLVVGATTQVVQVTSAAPLMDVSSSNVATGSTNQEIQALPITLYGNSSRSAISIAKTFNGVSFDPIESGGQEFMVLGRATINGITPGQWAYNIDGIPGSIAAGEREHDMQAPTPDMIDEVRVTNNTDVSEPFSPGTTVDLTMKSGTNELAPCTSTCAIRNSIPVIRFFRPSRRTSKTISASRLAGQWSFPIFTTERTRPFSSSAGTFTDFEAPSPGPAVRKQLPPRSPQRPCVKGTSAPSLVQ